LQEALIIPQKPLSAFIDCLWFQEGFSPTHARERVLPDGYTEIIINLHEDRLDVGDDDPKADFVTSSGSLMYGPRSKPFIISRLRPTAILGIHFRPGGLSPFLKLPVEELHNQTVPLEMIWGQHSHDLRERLLNAPSLPYRFQVVEEFLNARLRPTFTPHPAVTYTLHALRLPSNITKIGDIADHLGISSRRLSQVFREQVGMTPKAFHRLQRFQRVLRVVDRTHDIDWTALALSCGYFDQAHFIHDFKSFCGITPVEYYQQAGRRSGHVPVSS
jgi:AraC-like DNA-binding protein